MFRILRSITRKDLKVFGLVVFVLFFMAPLCVLYVVVLFVYLPWPVALIGVGALTFGIYKVAARL